MITSRLMCVMKYIAQKAKCLKINWSPQEKEQLVEAVRMKNVRKNIKIRCVGKMQGKMLSRNWNLYKIVGTFKYLWVWFLQRLNVISSILVEYQPSTCLLYFRISRKCVFSDIQSPEAYLEPCQTSMMKLLTVHYFRRSFAINFWQGPEYASDIFQCLLPLCICIKNWIISFTSVS